MVSFMEDMFGGKDKSMPLMLPPTQIEDETMTKKKKKKKRYQPRQLMSDDLQLGIGGQLGAG